MSNEIQSAEDFWLSIDYAHDWPEDDEAIISKLKARDSAIRAAERERYAKVVELAESIRNWSEAYPISVFKEPTTEQVHAVCDELGITVDCISAWVLRQFTKPWGNKAREALLELDEEAKI